MSIEESDNRHIQLLFKTSTCSVYAYERNIADVEKRVSGHLKETTMVSMEQKTNPHNGDYTNRQGNAEMRK